MSTLTPRPTSPSTFSAGTSQSSKMSSQVSDPRIPSLSSFWAVEYPGKSFSTMKAVMPRAPAAGSVFAYTTSTSACGPLVIHILVPFST